MSKILQPFGTLASEIVIRADTKGLVMVEAHNFVPVVKRGFRPEIQKEPMDSTVMVLALQKVVMDYSAALFQKLYEEQRKGQQRSNGQESNHDQTNSG